jgi:hypothetical protein
LKTSRKVELPLLNQIASQVTGSMYRPERPVKKNFAKPITFVHLILTNAGEIDLPLAMSETHEA